MASVGASCPGRNWKLHHAEGERSVCDRLVPSVLC